MKRSRFSEEQIIAILKEHEAGIPIGRGAESGEVADLIAYLASHRAAAIHGAEFIIDDGTVRTV